MLTRERVFFTLGICPYMYFLHLARTITQCTSDEPRIFVTHLDGFMGIGSGINDRKTCTIFSHHIRQYRPMRDLGMYGFFDLLLILKQPLKSAAVPTHSHIGNKNAVAEFYCLQVHTCCLLALQTRTVNYLVARIIFTSWTIIWHVWVSFKFTDCDLYYFPRSRLFDFLVHLNIPYESTAIINI